MNQNDIFYRFGVIVHAHRRLIIMSWIVLFIVSIVLSPRLFESFKDFGFSDPRSQSAEAQALMKSKIGYNTNQLIIVYHSDQLKADEQKYKNAIRYSLKNLEDFPLAHEIVYPSENKKQISKDKHTAYAVVLLKTNAALDSKVLDQFKSLVRKPSNLTMGLGGEPIFLDDTKKQTQIDLFKAEYVATPVAIITMLVVFGTVVAASLPILLGGLCALNILLILFVIGHYFSLSVFTINIALLLGLCLSIDYALLIINRYRDELELGKTNSDAVALTVATAGKAVFFSALAVFISLSALLLFPINILCSVGFGGLASVFVAAITAIVLLPAILSVLQNKINSIPVNLFKIKHVSNSNYKNWLVPIVIKSPLIFFLSILVVLLLFSYPFLKVNLGISDARILPENLQSRHVFDTLKDKFGENTLSPILAIVQSKNKDILTSKNISALYNFSEKVLDNPSVYQVSSIVNTNPRLTKSEYMTLYTTGQDHLSAELKKYLKVSTKKNMTIMSIVSDYPANSVETQKLVSDLRNMKLGNQLSLELTGSPVNTIDVMKAIKHVFPYAFAWIMGFTYLILLIFLRSVILPLKAILMTVISLSASYGFLVLIFQEGYLHQLLNFTPQGMLDVSLLIIIFCALFGVSMDYEVFLLSRIKERYEKTGDNDSSIIFGINHSYRIITSAALIVIFICFAFMFADIIMVKAFGLGIAIAVFIDAFIIRTILVPAVMGLLGQWNWYCPAWLEAILPKIATGEEPLEDKPRKSHH